LKKGTPIPTKITGLLAIAAPYLCVNQGTHQQLSVQEAAKLKKGSSEPGQSGRRNFKTSADQ